jgi:hypothetical protein
MLYFYIIITFSILFSKIKNLTKFIWKYQISILGHYFYSEGIRCPNANKMLSEGKSEGSEVKSEYKFVRHSIAR